MANNKVQLSDGTVLLDLTGDTVTPENLLSGATAHNAAGEQIVGAATAGGGITNFPTIEEVKANWTAVDLTNDFPDVIPWTSSIIFAFIIGDEDSVGDIGILFLEANPRNQDFNFQSICHKDENIHVFELYIDRGAINYAIHLSNVLEGETSVNNIIQNIIYYTTADNFFST